MLQSLFITKGALIQAHSFFSYSFYSGKMSYDPQHSTLRHFTTATQIRHFENTDGKSYVFDGTHTAYSTQTVRCVRGCVDLRLGSGGCWRLAAR